MLKGIKAVAAQALLTVLGITGALFSHAALADFTKTIEVTPGVQVNAVAVWYDLSCTQSAGGGSFTVVTAPTNGTLAYTTTNGIPPGCPAGGPALPAAQALYTWTAPSSSSATSDYIQLFYQTGDGSQSEYIDITVQLETPLLIASTLPNGMAGVAYGPATLVSGGTPPYTVSASGLPPGLSVGSNGMVSGTPAASDSGTYQATVSATDSAGATAGPKLVSITISPELVPPVIASMLPNGTAGVAYPSTVLVSGGTPPYTVSASGLPPGLSVGTNGMVSGTPAATDSGTYQVTVSVADSAGEAAGPQTVSIYITPASTCNATSNAASRVAPHLVIATSASGNAKRSAAASGSAAGQCTPLTITTKTLPPAQAYSLSQPRAPVYSAQLTASGGTGEGYVFDVTGLPPDLQLSGADTITGTVTSDVPDTYNLTISVADSAGNTATTQAPIELATICGDPAVNSAGDDRDIIVAEYLPPSPYPLGTKFNIVEMAPSNVITPSAVTAPHCDQFTQQYPLLNLGSPKHPATEDWEIVRDILPASLQAWRNLLIGEPPYPRAINSAYRTPVINRLASTTKTAGHHVYGDAIDLKTIGASTTACKQFSPVAADAACIDIRRVHNAARAAGFGWEETWQQLRPKNGKPQHYPCQPGWGACVHADLRNHPNRSYINP